MNKLCDLETMAECLGLPTDWLRDEFEAGRIPHLDASGVIRFDPEKVAEALAKRATQTRKPRRDDDV